MVAENLSANTFEPESEIIEDKVLITMNKVTTE